MSVFVGSLVESRYYPDQVFFFFCFWQESRRPVLGPPQCRDDSQSSMMADENAIPLPSMEKRGERNRLYFVRGSRIRLVPFFREE